MLHADLRRLGRVAGHGTGRQRRRGRLIRLAGAVDDPRGADRASQLSVLDAERGVHSGTDWTATAPGARYAVVASQVDDRPDQAVHTGHTRGVNAVCALQLDGRPVIASASDDRTVRIWDPHGRAVAIPVHAPVTSLAWAAGRLAVGLDVGVIVISLRHV